MRSSNPPKSTLAVCIRTSCSLFSLALAWTTCTDVTVSSRERLCNSPITEIVPRSSAWLDCMSLRLTTPSFCSLIRPDPDKSRSSACCWVNDPFSPGLCLPSVNWASADKVSPLSVANWVKTVLNGPAEMLYARTSLLYSAAIAILCSGRNAEALLSRQLTTKADPVFFLKHMDN